MDKIREFVGNQSFYVDLFPNGIIHSIVREDGERLMIDKDVRAGLWGILEGREIALGPFYAKHPQ